jgi:hypothetical protein
MGPPVPVATDDSNTANRLADDALMILSILPLAAPPPWWSIKPPRLMPQHLWVQGTDTTFNATDDDAEPPSPPDDAVDLQAEQSSDSKSESRSRSPRRRLVSGALCKSVF